LLTEASQIFACVHRAHECVQLIIVLEVPLQIHAATLFVLRTHSQTCITTSATTTVPPPFILTVLPFDKVALAFV
jgi:hypothetical protein